jgi:hypothetical protein
MGNFKKRAVIMNQFYKRTINWTIFIACFLILSCSSHQKDTNKTFIISSLAKIEQSHFTESPQASYGYYNFIIDSTGIIFFYSLQSGEWPASLFTKLTLFENLIPEHVVQVPNDNLVNFLKCNLRYLIKNEKGICIASQKDTINSKSFTTLFEYLSDSTKELHYWIRKTTIEENMVIYYKKSNRHYNPDCINWDSTKTYFPPRLVDEPVIKFKPPKIIKNE